jgi:hypothetical protein
VAATTSSKNVGARACAAVAVINASLFNYSEITLFEQQIARLIIWLARIKLSPTFVWITQNGIQTE